MKNPKLLFCRKRNECTWEKILINQTYLTLVTLRFFFNAKNYPAYEGEECNDKRAGQREEQEQQEDPAIRCHLDVLKEQLPRGHLKR